MPNWEASPRKKFVAAFFLAAYLLPLTFLFGLVFVAIASSWIARAAIVVGFGLPLAALWLSVFRYPEFERGKFPFGTPSRRTWIVLLLLSQGVLVVALTFSGPLLLQEIRGSWGLADGLVYLVGLAGLPGAIFALGVLLKAWKETGSNAI